MGKIEKVLQLYYKDGGINDAPFPSSEDQIEIGAFRYNATRMGGAPTITATVMYPICLDDVWTDSVYAKFNGEKYYLKQTPTSSYDNEDSRYKHSIELVSERSILDDVYFFDVVTDNTQGDDKPVSNSSKVTFFGNVYEFVKRLNASLKYSKVNYTVVVDESEEIPTEDKLVSFEDQFFSNVLQEIYNTYEVPYYFDGRTIHIGYSKGDVVIPDLEYGADNALLSITKTNANHKIVNRVTGIGSPDNIPYYYPNNSPKGAIEAVVDSKSNDFRVEISDIEKFSNDIKVDGTIVCNKTTISNLSESLVRISENSEGRYQATNNTRSRPRISTSFSCSKKASATLRVKVTPISAKTATDRNGNSYGLSIDQIDIGYAIYINDGLSYSLSKAKNITTVYEKNGFSGFVNIDIPSSGDYTISVELLAFYRSYTSTSFSYTFDLRHELTFNDTFFWEYEEEPIKIEKIGLRTFGTPNDGDTITQKLVKYVNTSKNLMPSIYRETDGANRFYNAVNEIYPFEFVDGYELKDGEYVGEDGMVHHPDHYEYKNPFVEGRPKEHIIKIDDIKPTIEGVINSMGLRIDMFSEFAYDDDDNDETLPEEDSSDRKFLHAYFFGKLRKLDFNLFDHAIEQQPMTVSFTSGDCGACNFEIGVSDEFPNKNPVLVNADGTLKRDSNGRVICGQFQKIKESELQDRQQDTINNEVWIALKKEEETYGILMPKAPKFNVAGEQIEAGHRPKACDNGKNNGDTFAVLGINLPKPYILNAEKKLEGEIIRYLQENNEEKFTFNINFSRIYFAENEDILKSLNENSKIRLIYDNKPYDLYVSSFSYSMSDGDILPDIKVTLDDTLKVSSNAIRNAINEVKSSLGSNINEVANAVAMQSRSYLSKIEDDNAQGVVNFSKGITFGGGGRVDVLDENSAKLTIDYLEIKKKATFTSLEIQEKSHVGGQMLITPAAMRCSKVEEFDNYYRCYFQTSGENGDEIFNQFVVGDQAICQTYNAWVSKYYWRLVVGIGENYIDLSKEDCDEESGIPSEGDNIIQLGNQVYPERQNAIVIAAYGDGSPYIIQYKGINNFELPDDKIVTKLSSTENIFTGKVHMEMGSDGLGDMQEFVDLQTLAGKANTNATNAQSKANTAIATADMAQQSADTANKNALQAGDAANAATEKAEEAIGKAAAAQEGLDNMEIGGTNLLRNSGFTGDYLSEQLADQKVLEGSAELYSSPLDHWNASSSVIVLDSTETISGKVANINGGTLSQKLYYKTVAGSDYVLSFRAKAAGSSSITITLGDISRSVALSSDWNDYEVSIAVGIEANNFSISNTKCEIGNLKLEKGNKASAWSASPLDNASDRAYYQSMKYIQNAFEGATDVFGGLVLTEQIQVGDYDSDKKEWVKMNGGMSGVYESDHDVAFWAGGTDKQAIETVMKYENDPTYQPTKEELLSMANFVVTHGGRAILNDAIVRGTVYAKDGVFEGEIRANRGNFGDMHIVSSETWGDAGLEGKKVYDGTEVHTLELYPDYFEMSAKDTVSGTTEYKEWIRISPYYYVDRYDMEGMVELYARKNRAAIHVRRGQFRGLHHDVLSTKEDRIVLYSWSPYVIILTTAADGNKSVILPEDAEEGTTFHIINAYRSPIIIGTGFNGQEIVLNTDNGELSDGVGWNEDGPNNPYKIEAYFDGNLWYICPIK